MLFPVEFFREHADYLEQGGKHRTLFDYLLNYYERAEERFRIGELEVEEWKLPRRQENTMMRLVTLNVYEHTEIYVCTIRYRAALAPLLDCPLPETFVKSVQHILEARMHETV